MATKSITKNVVVKGRSQCLALTRALENSKAASGTVPYSKACGDLSREQIREIFKGATK